MKHEESGFTLIELIMVIVILGILAATAIPRFTDLSTEAANASVAGVAGALGAAAAINVANCAAGAACTTISTGDSCSDFEALLEASAAPTGYTVGGTAPTCTVTHADSTVAGTFVGLAAAP